MKPHSFVIARWHIVCLLLVACSAGPALAQPSLPGRRPPRPDDKVTGFRENPRMLAAFKTVVANSGKSVVRVRSDDKDVALGTIITADGFVVTKNSQLTPGGQPSVLLRDGRALTAKVVGVDAKFDLAMLKIDAKGLVPVQWGESASAVVGDLLASPGTGADPVAVGVLSVAARSVRLRDLPPSLPPANSGFLGVGLEEADGGARILSIMPNSAADKAGLKVNDVVTLIADTPIIDSETMVNTIQRHKPGDAVAIKLRRGEQELEVSAMLEKRPPEPRSDRPDRRDFQNRMGSELSDRRGGFPQILQHDMALKPIDCGGPVVGLDGKAVGINIARAGRVESYAIPADAVKSLLDELKSGKLAPKAEPTTKATTKPVTTQPSK